MLELRYFAFTLERVGVERYCGTEEKGHVSRYIEYHTVFLWPKRIIVIFIFTGTSLCHFRAIFEAEMGSRDLRIYQPSQC